MKTKNKQEKKTIYKKRTFTMMPLLWQPYYIGDDESDIWLKFDCYKSLKFPYHKN